MTKKTGTILLEYGNRISQNTAVPVKDTAVSLPLVLLFFFF